MGNLVTGAWLHEGDKQGYSDLIIDLDKVRYVVKDTDASGDDTSRLYFTNEEYVRVDIPFKKMQTIYWDNKIDPMKEFRQDGTSTDNPTMRFGRMDHPGTRQQGKQGVRK